MLYDCVPPYPHFAHLSYSREPLKSFYVLQRLLITLLLVPYWSLYYAVLPRRLRPRPSWSLRQIIFVNFTRRIYKVTEVAGVTWGTRNPEEEPVRGSLKETRFEWVPPLEQKLRSGVVVVDSVPFKKVGTFVWPKDMPQDADPEVSAVDPPFIGIFLHGGGYCHMSAHENSRTSRIPRRLMKDGLFSEIYAVEYRLLQYAPFPAVIQDAAAVYANVISRFPSNCKVVLIGDSSGGNLALALARWLRDEGKLPMPDGLLLLSPSCDTSHAFPDSPLSYIPRPHSSTDYLVDTPEPRALLQRTFLGFKYCPHRIGRLTQHEIQEEEEKRLMEAVHSEYISPASPKVLARWGHAVVQNVAFQGEQFCKDDRIIDIASEAALQAPQAGGFPRSLDSATPVSEGNASYQNSRAFPSLFSYFPRTLVVVGDAERLEREVKSLVWAMEKDGVDLRTKWVRDAVHDILITADGWWDEKIREDVWKGIGHWVSGFK